MRQADRLEQGDWEGREQVTSDGLSVFTNKTLSDVGKFPKAVTGSSGLHARERHSVRVTLPPTKLSTCPLVAQWVRMGLLKRCPCFCIRVAEEEVRELDYSHCSLEEVPSTVFNHERTLESVKLDSNQIRDLPRVSLGWLASPLVAHSSLPLYLYTLGIIPLRRTSSAKFK